MKEKLQNWKEDIKNALCIIGGVTVVCGAVFAKPECQTPALQFSQSRGFSFYSYSITRSLT